MATPGGNQDADKSAASFKAFLMKNSTESNTNLYDHLTRVLMRVMDERPHNAVDVIEDLSRDVKRGLLQDNQSTLQDHQPTTTAGQLLAEQQRLLFSPGQETEEDEVEVETLLPNVAEIGFYLEQAGVGLGREETQRIFLALKQLLDSRPLKYCRLWGKVLGVQSNYVVAEVQYREGEEEQLSTEDEEKEGETQDDEEEDEMGEVIDPLPRSTYKPPPVVPKEANGTGANKFVYHVCKEPGLPWIELPSVTPAQISAARQIRRFFTGRLDAPVVSYPPFPGNEANYLRAQIARISAGTQVSPRGFYVFEEEEGDEEDEEPRDSYVVNPDFEGFPASEMAENPGSTWVHHVQHILKQGRCTWVNVAVKPEQESSEEEEEEKEEELDEPEPKGEEGPPLLTSLSQDADMFDTPPWSSRMSSTLTSQHAVAVLRSNLWPGAHAYACGKKFENIYIGWGLKFAGDGHTPSVPPPPQQEYFSGPEVSEALDPTLEEEQAQKAALEEQQASQEESEDMDGEEEEDDDDDEEDD
ncbi:radial spoke head protein 4 homolog A-like [Diretmus argenteus]